MKKKKKLFCFLVDKNFYAESNSEVSYSFITKITPQFREFNALKEINSNPFLNFLLSPKTL
jgi:hypothetical protein